MTRLILFGVLCLLALAAVVGGRFALQSYASAVADARAARALVATANDTADAATATAAALRADVQTLTAQSHAAVARADALTQTAAHYKRALAALSIPDTCRAVADTASAVIAAQDNALAQLRAAHVDDSTSVQRLTAALDTTTAALHTVRAAAVALVHADVALEAHTHAAWFVRILPKPGIGAVLGLDQTGKPTIAVGATLSWLF